jgi:hypothetical protein
MSRLLIIFANSAWLVLLVIGLPAAAQLRWGDVQISSAATNQKLIFGGLILAVILNLAGAIFLAKRPQKILCWEWTLVFGALLLAVFAHARGWLDFAWLTHTLQWLQNHL